MKKTILLIIISLFFLTTLQAQDQPPVSEWDFGGTSRLNFSQVNLTNWVAGGQNSLSLNGLVNFHAHKSKGKGKWENFLELGYGIINQGENSWIKTDDRIDFTSKYGQKINAKWSYAALLNFKTQFSDGYNYPNDSVKISGIFSPAYFLESFGMDFKPNEHFNVYIAPFTLKATIVSNQDLANAGAFGVEAAERDSAGNITRESEKIRTEFGGYVRLYLNYDIMKNVGLTSKAELFSNYLENTKNVDVNWEVLLSLKVNKYISATLSTQLLYDDDIEIAVDKNNDDITDYLGPTIQFKEVLGLGVTFTL